MVDGSKAIALRSSRLHKPIPEEIAEALARDNARWVMHAGGNGEQSADKIYIHL